MSFLEELCLRSRDCTWQHNIMMPNEITLNKRLKEMSFLEELCLRSRDCTWQHNIMMPNEITLNKLLKETLTGLNIRNLELKGFSMPWDNTGVFEIEIFSKSIQTLKLQCNKNGELTTIE